MQNYEILINWSQEDDCFVAAIPELKGCIAHGQSEYEALTNIIHAKELWISTAKEYGEEIPKPSKELLFV